MKRNVSFLLVEPENPNNIGAAARAIKNMGFRELALVSPPPSWRSEDSLKMAMAAKDLILEARVYEGVKAAVEDAALVIGTTRRKRRFRSNFFSFEEAIEAIKATGKKKRCIIMFGKESKGLSNEDLSYCDAITSIPTDASCPSINLAQAVMIFAFELYAGSDALGIEANRGRSGEFVNKKEEYEVLEMLQHALEVLDYSNRSDVKERIRTTFHDLIKRNGLLKREAQMFKGLLKRVREKAGSRVLA